MASKRRKNSIKASTNERKAEADGIEGSIALQII